MSILSVGVGFVMLCAGRPVYAVFVGGISFLLGTYLTNLIDIVPSQWNELALPLLLAAFGALAAFVFRRWSAGLAGFIAGGYVLVNLPEVFGAEEFWYSQILFLIVGVICVLLLLLWFDISLVILSALTGVTLILENVKFETLDTGMIFFILLFFGMVTQFILFQYGKPSPD